MAENEFTAPSKTIDAINDRLRWVEATFAMLRSDADLDEEHPTIALSMANSLREARELLGLSIS